MGRGPRTVSHLLAVTVSVTEGKPTKPAPLTVLYAATGCVGTTKPSTTVPRTAPFTWFVATGSARHTKTPISARLTAQYVEMACVATAKTRRTARRIAARGVEMVSAHRRKTVWCVPLIADPVIATPDATTRNVVEMVAGERVGSAPQTKFVPLMASACAFPNVPGRSVAPMAAAEPAERNAPPEVSA